MILSDYDPDAPPVRVGDRVRLRPLAEWHDQAPAPTARPVECCYAEAGRAIRTIYWSAELDRQAGHEFAVVGLGPAGLPAVARDGWSGWWQLHPDWLEPAAPPADPAGGPCVCDLHAVLMVAGCRCGRIGREREARR